MESYKHSCPFCGQHIEYTAGYCGRQMVCPICSQTITFPAVPPGKIKSNLHIKRAQAADVKKWPIDFAPFIATLVAFKHWNLVLACVVPFLVIAALLFGASFVKTHFSDDSNQASVPAVHADPNAWQKMAELTRAEQAVQQQVKNVIAAHNMLLTAQAKARRLHSYYEGKAMDASAAAAVQSQYQQADQEIQRAQNTLSATRNVFENALRVYQDLGGTIDYHQQLPQ